jgi:anti-sigma regulatory factor (Ser/Thr protein kinase)
VGVLAVRHDLASAGAVRAELAADLTAQGVPPSACDDAVLVASELVGNAVVHCAAAGRDLEVSWDVGDADITVRVTDPSEALPAARQAALTATSGRGLAIVEALSAEWGVDVAPDGGGKQVWARVPVSSARGATA